MKQSKSNYPSSIALTYNKLLFLINIGNCEWGNTTREDCPLDTINITNYQTDSSCLTPCGEDDSCEEERCASSESCIEVCQSCEDLGETNPCTALMNVVFGKNYFHYQTQCALFGIVFQYFFVFYIDVAWKKILLFSSTIDQITFESSVVMNGRVS